MRFYAFQFQSGANTTTGQPNPTTGHFSTAGDLVVFSTREKRDAWVRRGRATSAMRGNCRYAVTAKEARTLHLGMTMDEYNSYVEGVGIDEYNPLLDM
jgi:hypothetical protein